MMFASVRRARRRERSRGQSLVEFALIVPVFLAVLGAILDAGFFLNARLTVVNAVHDGARWAVTQKDNTLAINETMNSGSGPLRANSPDLTQSDLVISTTCKPAPSRTACDFDPGGSRDAAQGDSVNVTATYVYHSFFASIFGSPCPGNPSRRDCLSLSATDQVVIE